MGHSVAPPRTEEAMVDATVEMSPQGRRPLGAGSVDSPRDRVERLVVIAFRTRHGVEADLWIGQVIEAASRGADVEAHPVDVLGRQRGDVGIPFEARARLAADAADESIWGIVHSHVASPAKPSVTDTGVAGYPDALYLIVSLAQSQAAPDGEPGIRAWWIVDREATEVELAIEG